MSCEATTYNMLIKSICIHIALHPANGDVDVYLGCRFVSQTWSQTKKFKLLCHFNVAEKYELQIIKWNALHKQTPTKKPTRRKGNVQNKKWQLNIV